MRKLALFTAALALVAATVYGCDRESPTAPQADEPAVDQAPLMASSMNNGKDVEILWAEISGGGSTPPSSIPAVSRGVESVTGFEGGYRIQFRRRVTDCAVVISPTRVNMYFPNAAGPRQLLYDIQVTKESDVAGFVVGPNELAINAVQFITPPGGGRQADIIEHTLVLFCPVRSK